MAAPTLILKNQTGADIIYASIGLTVPANSNATVTGIPNKQTICGDQALVSDIVQQNMFIGDGSNTYTLGAALEYLNYTAQEVGDTVGPHINFRGQTTISFRNKYSNLTGNSTTTVKSGVGSFYGLMINNNNTGGTATIYDNTAASGTKICTIAFGTPSGGLLSGTGQESAVFVGPLGIEFSTGLTVVLAGSTSNDVTVLYQ